MRRSKIKIKADKKPCGKPPKYNCDKDRKDAIKSQKRNWWSNNRGSGSYKNCREIAETLRRHTEDLEKLQNDVYEIKQKLWQDSISQGGSK